jgi:hypothetical protein
LSPAGGGFEGELFEEASRVKLSFFVGETFSIAVYFCFWKKYMTFHEVPRGVGYIV